MAKRAATSGAMDMAAAALGEFHTGPNDVLVDRNSSAARPRQDDNHTVARYDDVGCTVSQRFAVATMPNTVRGIPQAISVAGQRSIP